MLCNLCITEFALAFICFIYSRRQENTVNLFYMYIHNYSRPTHIFGSNLENVKANKHVNDSNKVKFRVRNLDL